VRTFTSCHQCAHESLKQGLKPSSSGYLVDINDDGVYVEECSNGHLIRFVHDSLPYSLLYEGGVMAML
jgi:hypothetical protein